MLVLSRRGNRSGAGKGRCCDAGRVWGDSVAARSPGPSAWGKARPPSGAPALGPGSHPRRVPAKPRGASSPSTGRNAAPGDAASSHQLSAARARRGREDGEGAPARGQPPRAGGGGNRAVLRVLSVPLRCENMDCLLGFIDSRARPAPSRTHRPPLTTHLPEDLPSGTPATPPPLGPAWPPGAPRSVPGRGEGDSCRQGGGEPMWRSRSGQISAHGQGRRRDPPRKAEAPSPTAHSSAGQCTYPYTPRLPHPFTDGWTLPGGSVVKNLPANAGDSGLIPAWGRSPAGTHGNALQCSCLENPMDRGAWWATARGVARRPHD